MTNNRQEKLMHAPLGRHQIASAVVRLLVTALALGASAGASLAQNMDPEVEISWGRSDAISLEGYRFLVWVLVDQQPGRRVSFRVDVTHHRGATEDDYALLGFGHVGPTRRAQVFYWNATADDFDDDCEWVELRLVPESPGVTVSDQPFRIRIVDDDGAAVDCGWGDLPGGGGAPPGGDVGGGPLPPGPEPDSGSPPPLQPPTAAFTVTGATCDAELCRVVTGEDVRFTDTSAGTVARRSWDFDVTPGGAPSGASVRYAWSSPGFYRVNLSVSGAGAKSTASRVFLVEAAEPAGNCESGPYTLCLRESRYQVRATWTQPDGEVLAAGVVHAGTNDSGLLYFPSRENWEVLVKVLDGCSYNGRDWVFLASATTLEYEVTVTDTTNGETRKYGNEAGTSSPAATDTSAFPGNCDPSGGG